jgi:sRNA-binding protein
VARITFQKRQKEMKRLEKQRMKAERRAQRKLEKNAATETPTSDEHLIPAEPDTEPQN